MRKLFRIAGDGAGSNSVFSWQPRGDFLATSGSNGMVYVWDRHGERISGGSIELKWEGNVKRMEWDHRGEYLAILQEGSGVVEIWDIKTKQSSSVETNLKDLTFLKWSRSGPELAVGTAKGNLLMYNIKNKRKIPILGKHPKRIVCGSWSSSGKLALGSEDCTLTISDKEGNTDDQRTMKHQPLEMLFATQKGTRKAVRDSSETHLSINLGSSLLLFDLDDPENPLELAFQPKYGKIVRHLWFDDGHIMLGFSEGWLVIISTQMQEIGEEMFSARFHHRQLFDLAYSPAIKLSACCGDSGIKILDCGRGFDDVKPEELSLSGERCTKVSWSPDGQILTVATSSGSIYAFLARMKIANAAWQSQVAYLSSLREVSIVDVRTHLAPFKVPVNVEAQFVSLGGMHVAAGSKKEVHFHRFLQGDVSMVYLGEYQAKVQTVKMNDHFAAVLAGGTVILHEIEPSDPSGQRRRRVFPEEAASGVSGNVTAIALTSNLLIYATTSGSVDFFLLEKDWKLLEGTSLRHTAGIKALYPNASGTRLVIIDEHDEAFVANPVTGDMCTLKHQSRVSPRHVMWDLVDSGVIQLWDGEEIHSYVYSPTSRWGPMVTKLGPIDITPEGEIVMQPEARALPSGCSPILCCAGVMTCQDAIGNLKSVTSPQYAMPRGANMPLLKFTQSLSLHKLRSAWDAALNLDGRAFWLALSFKAMELMDVAMAIRVYRQLGDAGMVMALERIAGVEDRNLLAGHIALLYDDYNKAQEHFLASSQPLAALEMRRDLLHWDQALKLAQTLAPHEVPEISVEYARQLEFRMEYDAALQRFEAALQSVEPHRAEALRSTCLAGIARCTLRLGDLRRGMSYVKESNDMDLCRECARILEKLKQKSEAASLYEMGGQWNRAADIYITAGNLTQAAAVIDKVSHKETKLLTEYAKQCEVRGQLEEAVKAYERARDMDSVVRLCLDQLKRPERAFDIVRKNSSSTGAQHVAQYCRVEGNYRGAIEFLLMAKCYDEALDLAKTHDCMQVYTSILGDGIGPHEASLVAEYYQAHHDLGNAGYFYSLAGQYSRALTLFLQCGTSQIDRAIEVVGKARNDMLTHTLIDFLIGESDGTEKEPVHINRLYLALGNYDKAARTAVIIAKQEQERGAYMDAHSTLFKTIRELDEHKVWVPQSLMRPFILLHSYTIVKKHVNRDNHTLAARLLLRVARNISKFPDNEQNPKTKIDILTATVFECKRAKLMGSAFEYAKELMREFMKEHQREKTDPKIKRMIENIIRRRNTEEESEQLSPCPISKEPIPIMQLECPTTRDALPMCVITGQHMVIDDWCFCPRSNMPALYSEYVKHIEAEIQSGDGTATDPVTNEPVTVSELTKVSEEDALAYITAYNSMDQEETPAEDGAAS